MTVLVAVSNLRSFSPGQHGADRYPPDGFFDSGLLLQALRASTQGRGDAEEEDAHTEEQAHVQARHAVGKKLRLAEY